MGLSQIKSENRIIFLKKFAAELVINSGEPGLIENKIRKQAEVEKLRQKFLKPFEPEGGFRKSITDSIFQEPVYSKKTEQPPQNLIIKKIPPKIIIPKKPLFHRTRPPEQIPVHDLRRTALGFMSQKQNIQQNIASQQSQMQPRIQQTFIRPEAKPRPEGFSLGKIELFLKDSSIQSIECPGPGKNILLKRRGKINTTKVILNPVEITHIIDSFSQQARIPVAGGILKAAVGDLIISAVISEFVGSRFIINRITPYNLIQ